MAFVEKDVRADESLLHEAAPFIQLIALLAIPAAGGVALVLSLQIPRFIYGKAVPLFLAAEIGSLIGVFVLVLGLRACLALPSAPSGFYRNVLDFLAMARWHPSVKAALLGLMVLPLVWALRADHYWLISMLRTMGRRALRSGDFQDELDRFAVVYQLALTGGVPLLFTLHMFSRTKAAGRVWPWLLVPVLFVGTAIAVVVLVAIIHS